MAEYMRSAGPPTQVITATTATNNSAAPVVTLKLRKPKTDKKIKWTEETVDNEEMGKKKSKCCCIYRKPRMFGESSSDESDGGDETDHCRGHKGKCYNQSGRDAHPTPNPPGRDKSEKT